MGVIEALGDAAKTLRWIALVEGLLRRLPTWEAGAIEAVLRQVADPVGEKPKRLLAPFYLARSGQRGRPYTPRPRPGCRQWKSQAAAPRPKVPVRCKPKAKTSLSTSSREQIWAPRSDASIRCKKLWMPQRV